MGKYDDISDELSQYVSKHTAEAILDATENGPVLSDTLSVTGNQGGQGTEIISDMDVQNKLKLADKVMNSFIMLIYFPLPNDTHNHGCYVINSAFFKYFVILIYNW